MTLKLIPILLSFLLIAPTLYSQKNEKPNVIIIYSDDVGYGDVGVYGATKIPTPNIDKLASKGIMFTDGHSPAATCTPSRYAMLTGKYAFRKKGTGILKGDAPLSISTETFTLPKLFKAAGYKTAAIGKWHLGLGNGTIDWNKQVKPGPLEIGFDYSFLLPATGDRVPCVYLENYNVINLDSLDPITVSYKSPLYEYPIGIDNPESMTVYKADNSHSKTVINGIGRIGYMSGGKQALWDDETIADVLVDKSRKFISENKDEPFFLYLATQDIHVPRVPAQRFRGKSENGLRGDAMVQLDWCVGEIVKILEKNNLTNNTILIFTSDNGPVYNDGYFDGSTVQKFTEQCDNGHCASGELRGGKYSSFEGGTRVPFIINWPEKIKPQKSSALVSHIDFMASFGDLLNIPIPAIDKLDSQNFLNTFLGNSHIGRSTYIEQGPSLALRKGNWKYISEKINKKRPNKSVEAALYNLDEDISETTNLANQKPKLVVEMKNELQQIINKNK